LPSTATTSLSGQSLPSPHSLHYCILLCSSLLIIFLGFMISIANCYLPGFVGLDFHIYIYRIFHFPS
jgi:hypothetical protein